MSKITLSNVADLTNSTTAQATINSNSATVQSAFDNTLSRDGTFPNTMGAVLDMNSFNIINLPTPISGSSPARLVDIVSNPTLVLTIPTVGTSGSTVPLLNGINTWSALQTFTAAITSSGATRNLIGTSIATGNLCVGSNFSAAQPYVFNILDNQAPADSRRMFYGFDDLTRPANGSWYSTACGAANPDQFVIPSGGYLAGSLSEVDIGIDNTVSPLNTSIGHYIRHNVSKGTGAGIIGVEIQAFALAGFTPHGASANSGVVGIQVNGCSDVGGFTFGGVISSINTADASGYTNAAVGLEIDNDLRYNTNGSQIGIQVVSQDGTTVGGRTVAGDNCAYTCLKSTGGGYKNAYQIGNQAGTSFPLLSTGAILKCYSSSTITDGIEISSLTFTGNAIKTPGFTVDPSGAITTLSTLAVPAGGTAGKGVKFSTTSNLGVFFGSGVPTLSAAQGSLYIRTDGSSSSTRLYVNSTGSTTWVNITSAS